MGFAQVGAESGWRAANTKSIQDTLTKENGFDLKFSDAQQKQENQIKAIRAFIAQGVDGILLAPVVATGWDQCAFNGALSPADLTESVRSGVLRYLLQVIDAERARGLVRRTLESLPGLAGYRTDIDVGD